MKNIKLMVLLLMSVLMFISCSKKDNTAEHIKNKDVYFTIESVKQTEENTFIVEGKLRNDSEKEIDDFKIPLYIVKKDGQKIDLGTMEYNPLTSHANIKYQHDFSDIVKNTDFNLEEIKEVYAEFEAGYRVDIDGTDRQ